MPKMDLGVSPKRQRQVDCIWEAIEQGEFDIYWLLNSFGEELQFKKYIVAGLDKAEKEEERNK